MNIQHFSIYSKYLYSEPTVLQTTSVAVSVQNATPIPMFSQALYVLYLPLAFKTYDQTLSCSSLPPIFLLYLQVS